MKMIEWFKKHCVVTLTDDRPWYKQVVSGILMIPMIILMVCCGFLTVVIVYGFAEALCEVEFYTTIAKIALFFVCFGLYFLIYDWAKSTKKIKTLDN